MIGIRLPWQPQQYINNSFALSHIKSMFGMEVHWNNRLSHIPHSYGNFVAMATTVKPH